MKHLITLATLFLFASLLPTGAAEVAYTLPQEAQASLAVYDSHGSLVRTLLSGEKLAAGAHAAEWDGLDRNGLPVAPGKYEWRSFASAGLKAEWLLALGTSTDWPAYDEWVGNHDGPHAVALDAEGGIYIGAASGEGVSVLLKMSPDGKKRLWSTGQMEVSDGVERLAVIGDTVFMMQRNKNVFALKTAGGNNREGYGKKFFNALHADDFAWRWEMSAEDKKRVHVTPMDMEAVGTQLACSYRDYGLVRFFSSVDGALVREVKIERPGALAADAKGTLFIAAEGKIFALAAGDEKARVVVEDAGLRSPVGFTVEPVSGDFIVALNGDKAQHIRRYHGGKLAATLGRETGRAFGAYEPRDFRGLHDVQADGRGGFYTVEAVPRRVAHFSGAAALPDREWFGSVHWGSMLAIDPEDPTIAYFEMEERQFMRAKLDLVAHRWTLTHIYERLDYPQPDAVGLRWQVRHRGGRTYLVNCAENALRYAPFLIEVVDGGARLKMASFLVRAGDEKLPWWAEALKREGGKGGGSNAASWTDTNGDGVIQSDEARPGPETFGSGHVWVDAEWNVFVTANNQRPRPIGPDGRAVLWYRIPNRAQRAEETPHWDWHDAQPVMAEVPAEFPRWQWPAMTGIAVDEAGAVYQITMPSYRVGATPEEQAMKEERHGSGWPHTYSATARIFKWRADGTLEWAIGKKANSKQREKPGELSCPVALLGFAGDKFFLHDRAGRVTTAWTKDGLAAGYVFDRHMDDGLPAETIYRVTGDVSPKNFLMGDDHVIQNFTLARDGQIYWATPGQDATALYRIHDWQGGARQSGSIEIKAPVPAAQRTGTGLSARYFPTADLTGPPALERVDAQVWFRGVWLAFSGEIKASPFFPPNSPLPERTFSAQWTGEIEPRFSEDYRLGVYLQGIPGGPKGEITGSKARLWIGDKLVLDHWDEVAPGKPAAPVSHTVRSTPLAWKSGQRVPIRLEFSAADATAPHLHLFWESRTQDREHIPATALYPTK